MILAVIALLAQSPADQHRLTWVKQADGSVTTEHSVGNQAIKATCRTEAQVVCVVIRRTVPIRIAVQRFELDRLPTYTIGFEYDPQGYGCEWIEPTRTTIETIRNRQGKALTSNVVRAGAGWSTAQIAAFRATYFPCRAILEREHVQSRTRPDIPYP